MGWDALDLIAQAVRAHARTGLINSGWETPDSYPLQHLTPLALALPHDVKGFAQRFVLPDATARVSLLPGSGNDAHRTPPLTFALLAKQHVLYVRPARTLPCRITPGGDRPSQVIFAPLQKSPYQRLRVSRSLRSFHFA
jgi:hypothetical protein